jgi:hypothetical protein
MSSMKTMTNLSNSGMNMVHEVHEVCRRICQPKRHNEVLVETVSHRESSLVDIFSMNFNLMIARAEINLGEHLGSC